MRKYLSLAILVFIPIFSGCSLLPTPTDNSDTAPPAKKYAISQSIWKSTDGGKTWEAKNSLEEKPRVADVDVLSMAINPKDTQNIYLGLRKGGIMKTIDGGESWEFSKIFTSEKVYGLALDPEDSKIIYASGVYQGRGKMFKSVDSGETWTEIYTSASDGPLVIGMALDTHNRQILYAATSDGQIIKSSDSGASWQNIYHSRDPVTKIAIDKDNGNLVYFLTLGGTLSRSRDGGKNIENISKNFSRTFSSNQKYAVLATDPNNSGWVYLAGKGGIIVSKNGGDFWEKIVALSDPGSFPVGALAVSFGESRRLVYGAAQASYKSEDFGVNWMTAQFNVEKKIRLLEYDPVLPDVVYMGFSK